MENGRTNYTKKIREYCQKNNGSLLDITKIKNAEFVEVPYKTLLKF